jgi:hypothetical protein
VTGKGLPTTREAKEFLVAQIVEEAQREGVSLSEVERKMLYFTETGWTLPDMMQVNDEFDRDYDQNEYEEKIAKLIRSSTKRVRKENPTEYGRWLDAIRKLSKEDHYILVMCARAGIGTPSRDSSWGATPLLVAILSAIIILGAIGRHYGLWVPRPGTEFGSYTIDDRANKFVSAIWIAGVVVLIFLWALPYIDPKHKISTIVSRCVSGTRSLFKPPAK